MIYLEFTDLNEEAHNLILVLSNKDVKRKFGNDISKYVRENYSSFETAMAEEAFRNLYFYTYKSRIQFLKSHV